MHRDHRGCYVHEITIDCMQPYLEFSLDATRMLRSIIAHALEFAIIPVSYQVASQYCVPLTMMSCSECFPVLHWPLKSYSCKSESIHLIPESILLYLDYLVVVFPVMALCNGACPAGQLVPCMIFLTGVSQRIHTFHYMSCTLLVCFCSRSCPKWWPKPRQRYCPLLVLQGPCHLPGNNVNSECMLHDWLLIH